jgi:hypothetical protein
VAGHREAAAQRKATPTACRWMRQVRENFEAEKLTQLVGK